MGPLIRDIQIGVQNPRLERCRASRQWRLARARARDRPGGAPRTSWLWHHAVQVHQVPHALQDDQVRALQGGRVLLHRVSQGGLEAPRGRRRVREAEPWEYKSRSPK